MIKYRNVYKSFRNWAKMETKNKEKLIKKNSNSLLHSEALYENAGKDPGKESSEKIKYQEKTKKRGLRNWILGTTSAALLILNGIQLSNNYKINKQVEAKEEVIKKLTKQLTKKGAKTKNNYKINKQVEAEKAAKEEVIKKYGDSINSYNELKYSLSSQIAELTNQLTEKDAKIKEYAGLEVLVKQFLAKNETKDSINLVEDGDYLTLKKLREEFPGAMEKYTKDALNAILIKNGKVYLGIYLGNYLGKGVLEKKVEPFVIKDEKTRKKDKEK